MHMLGLLLTHGYIHMHITKGDKQKCIVLVAALQVPLTQKLLQLESNPTSPCIIKQNIMFLLGRI